MVKFIILNTIKYRIYEYNGNTNRVITSSNINPVNYVWSPSTNKLTDEYIDKKVKLLLMTLNL